MPFILLSDSTCQVQQNSEHEVFYKKKTVCLTAVPRHTPVKSEEALTKTLRKAKGRSYCGGGGGERTQRTDGRDGHHCHHRSCPIILKFSADSVRYAFRTGNGVLERTGRTRTSDHGSHPGQIPECSWKPQTSKLNIPSRKINRHVSCPNTSWSYQEVLFRVMGRGLRKTYEIFSEV